MWRAALALLCVACAADAYLTGAGVYTEPRNWETLKTVHRLQMSEAAAKSKASVCPAWTPLITCLLAKADNACPGKQCEGQCDGYLSDAELYEVVRAAGNPVNRIYPGYPAIAEKWRQDCFPVDQKIEDTLPDCAPCPVLTRLMKRYCTDRLAVCDPGPVDPLGGLYDEPDFTGTRRLLKPHATVASTIRTRVREAEIRAEKRRLVT